MDMRACVVVAFWVLAALTPSVQGQVPSTDIFLLTVEDGSVAAVERVTDREGYDNQPQFLPDGKGLVTFDQRPALRIWPTNPHQSALAHRPRLLTPDERDTWIEAR